jgi:hypothetical protein
VRCFPLSAPRSPLSAFAIRRLQALGIRVHLWLNSVFQVHISKFYLAEASLAFPIQYGNPKASKNLRPKTKPPVANKELTRIDLTLKSPHEITPDHQIA